jgi:general secretion pathway protein N
MPYRWLLLPLLLVLLLVTLPLRQVLYWSGVDRRLAASGVEGTVWGGVVRQARLGSLALGDVRLALDPLSLVTGRIGFDFAADGALAGAGTVALYGDAALRAGELRFPIQALGAGLPLRGDMRLSGLDIAFRNGRCSRGQGTAVVEQARLEQGGVRLTPETSLRGVLGCAGDEAVLRLSGRSGGAEIHSVLRIAADGVYRLESRVMGLGQGSNALAAMAGFRAEADGYARIDQGRLAL